MIRSQVYIRISSVLDILFRDRSFLVRWDFFFDRLIYTFSKGSARHTPFTHHFTPMHTASTHSFLPDTPNPIQVRTAVVENAQHSARTEEALIRAAVRQRNVDAAHELALQVRPHPTHTKL